MRDIIFRGKRIDNGEWVYGSLLLIENLAYVYNGDSCPSEVNFEYEFIAVDPATVGQYTGLKDKNGKEIWGGDIIECIGSDNKPIRHLVRYNDEYGGYSQLLFMGNGITCELYDGGLISQKYICEMGKYIIGNIHDNPELLK